MYPRIVNFKGEERSSTGKIDEQAKTVRTSRGLTVFFVGNLFTSNAILYQLLSRCFWNNRFTYASTIDGD